MKRGDPSLSPLFEREDREISSEVHSIITLFLPGLSESPRVLRRAQRPKSCVCVALESMGRRRRGERALYTNARLMHPSREIVFSCPYSASSSLPPAAAVGTKFLSGGRKGGPQRERERRGEL